MEKQTPFWRKRIAKALSVLLVIMLMVTPLTLVALSMLQADTLTQVMSDVVAQELRSAKYQDDPLDFVLKRLPESADSQQIEKVLTDVLGEQPDAETVAQIMESDLAEDFLELYTEDLTASLAGKKNASRLDGDKLREITDDNMDDLLEIAKDANPSLSAADLKSLESNITRAIDENADAIVAAVPDPSEMKSTLTDDIPGMDLLLRLLGAKTVITAVAIALLLLLGGGIFLCLLEDFLGFRSLAVNLFVGGGFNGLLSTGMLVLTPVLMKLVPVPVVRTVMDALLEVVNRGMLLWTVGLLVAGGILLGAYFVIKTVRAKKIPA